MTKKNKKEDDSISPSYVGKLFSWIFGILFILAGFGSFISEEIITGLILIIMAIVLLPPTYKLFKRKMNFELSKSIKTTILIVGFILLALTADTQTNSEIIDNSKDFANNNQYSEICNFVQSYQGEDSINATKEHFNINDVELNKALQYCVNIIRQKQAYDLEMNIENLTKEFSGLTEIQQKEKSENFKGQRIKTKIYVSKVDKASLSSQYVVMEMYNYPYNLIPHIKAFFPAEEKSNLLSLNEGDILIFSGEFVSYKEGYMTTTIEFTKSKFLGIQD